MHKGTKDTQQHTNIITSSLGRGDLFLGKEFLLYQAGVNYTIPTI